jgi:DNA replication protein DnaC
MSRCYEEVIASINEKNKAAAEAGKLEAEQQKVEKEKHRQWLQTDEGKQWLAAEREKEVQQCILQEALDWRRDALMIGVPRRLAPAALYGKDIQETPALLYARQYVDGGDLQAGASLVLLGKASRGKSFAATAILRAQANRGDLRFFHFPSIVGALLDPERRKTTLEEAKESRLVVFDEIGGGFVKPGGLAEMLFEEIIFWRHGEFRPTIFTSNLTGDEFAGQFSDRVIDRLREWGPVWACGGPSLRERYQPAQTAPRPEAA